MARMHQHLKEIMGLVVLKGEKEIKRNSYTWAMHETREIKRNPYTWAMHETYPLNPR
jgi:hypothetical protein